MPLVLSASSTMTILGGCVLRACSFFTSASVSATMPDKTRFAPGATFSTAPGGLDTGAKLLLSFIFFNTLIAAQSGDSVWIPPKYSWPSGFLRQIP